MEATFRVAGETDLADRIRPTVRQLTRNDDKEEQEAKPEATSTEASSEAPASESAESESGGALAPSASQPS